MLPIDRLYKQFGAQGWWPRVVANAGRFTVQHHADRSTGLISRSNKDRAFEVAVGAMLTQNTAWSNVEKSLVCLAEHGLLHVQTLANARLSTLERCVKSSGYYRQKAQKLKVFSQFLVDEFQGDVTKLCHVRSRRAPTPDEIHNVRERLLSLWGIGPETADTILLYGLELPVFVVDTYTRRWLVEVTQNAAWLTRSYCDVQTFCQDQMPGSVTDWQETHALIVAWGKKRP